MELLYNFLAVCFFALLFLRDKKIKKQVNYKMATINGIEIFLN